MLLHRVVIILCTIVLSISNVQAQDSLKYEHPMIELLSTKLGGNSKSILKDPSTRSIDQLAISSSHLQSNGPDLLTTLLIRGMGSRHTAILWNGWNLQSPVNGVLDLSLVASSDYTFDIRPQSASSAIGNAAAAGSIVLEPRSLDTLYTAQLRLLQTDYGNSEVSAMYREHLSKLDYKISARRVHNENAFNFNKFGTWETQQNAQKDALDGNIDLKYSLTENQNIKASMWVQHSERQIPATKTTTYKNEVQNDKNVRAHLAWNRLADMTQSSIRMGYLNEYIGYQSDLVPLSTSDASTWLLEGISKRQIKKGALYAGIQLKTVQVRLISGSDVDGFDRSINRKQASIWAGSRLDISSIWSIDLGNRLELVDEAQAIWTFHVEPKVFLFDTHWSYRLSSVFQQATINDLYWPQGGNIDLNNESGVMQELAAKKQVAWARNKINMDVALFSYRAKDWIIWSPNGSGFWTPENRRNVLSQGVDMTLASTTKLNERSSIDASVNYIYTHAVVTDDDNQRIIDKQLLYVPRHKLNVTTSLTFNTWRVSANTSWVGTRYTTNDNTTAVDAYPLSNVSFLKEIRISTLMSTLNIDIHNVLNTDYEVVKFYANPLRTITFAAAIKI